VRLPALTSAVESHQTSVRHPPFLWQAVGIRPSMHECGLICGKGPSGEELTPGRSEPLELCSTEDHRYHLQNEAAKYCVQPTPGRIYRSRLKVEERCDARLASPLAGSCPASFHDRLPIWQKSLQCTHRLNFVMLDTSRRLCQFLLGIDGSADSILRAG
jgi:hypothetical protein